MWGKKARRSPRKIDLLLIEAHQLYEESLCSCGHSALLSYSEAYADEFDLNTETTCYACAVAESDRAADAAKYRSPGQKISVHNAIDDPGERRV
jgi:hypothetical protein